MVTNKPAGKRNKNLAAKHGLSCRCLNEMISSELLMYLTIIGAVY